MVALLGFHVDLSNLRFVSVTTVYVDICSLDDPSPPRLTIHYYVQRSECHGGLLYKVQYFEAKHLMHRARSHLLRY
jgi:hypothetical protein